MKRLLNSAAIEIIKERLEHSPELNSGSIFSDNRTNVTFFGKKTLKEGESITSLIIADLENH